MFRALFGQCEWCEPEEDAAKKLPASEATYVGKHGHPFKEGLRRKYNTEVIDVFTKGKDNSIYGYHKDLGFHHFEFRTVMCRKCLEEIEANSEKLFAHLNCPEYQHEDKRDGVWGQVYRTRALGEVEIFTPDSMSDEEKKSLLEKWAKEGTIDTALIIYKERVPGEYKIIEKVKHNQTS